jgi:predicted MFS family arabinose efflux permease
MEVEPQAVILAITARSALGVLAPFLGPLADLRGRKAAMLTGLLLFAGANLLLTSVPVYPVFFISMLIGMVGKIIFDPAMQAFLGDQVVYARRGLAIAFTELGWSAGYLIGIPVFGFIMARHGWQAPFPILVLLAAMAIFLLWRILPESGPRSDDRSSLRTRLAHVLKHPSAVAALGVGLLISAGNEVIGIVYGIWMEQSFGLQVAALGAATAVIGLAELSGEGLVAALVDRWGKRRAVAIGIVTNIAASVALPTIAVSLPGALIGLFILFISFEFTIVSSIPLMTEQVPGSRGALMGFNIAALTGGRAVGALIGAPLLTYGLFANGFVAASLNLIGLVILIRFVQE